MFVYLPFSHELSIAHMHATEWLLALLLILFFRCARFSFFTLTLHWKFRKHLSFLLLFQFSMRSSMMNNMIVWLFDDCDYEEEERGERRNWERATWTTASQVTMYAIKSPMVVLSFRLLLLDYSLLLIQIVESVFCEALLMSDCDIICVLLLKNMK